MSDHFDSWFSGFVDGEGYFGLALSSGTRAIPRWYPHLTIALRDDDSEVLERIHARFGGTLAPIPARSGTNTNPSLRWRVASIDECMALVEHFEAWPLFGKKRRDFALWALGVRHMHEFRGTKGIPNSSKVDTEYIAALSQAMRAIRVYGAHGVQPSPLSPVLMFKGA